ncbi:MAG: tetratricopeptide repeat protein [Elusimicrobia bacterium]|nr:tetratricopeptide repeat protein [Elusimicrobiota bacterium]
MRRAAWLLAAALAAGCAGMRRGMPTTLDSARSLFEAGRYADVRALLSDRELQELSDRDVPRGYELLGMSQERLGLSDGALKAYQVGVALHPKDVNLLTHLGNLLHNGGLDAHARPYYERILKLSPENAAAHLGLAEVDHRLGFLDRAAAHYETALKEWNDQPRLWVDYARVLHDMRRYADALEAAGKAASIADGPAARGVRASALWGLGRRVEALQELDAAQRLDPSQLPLAQQRALWLLEAGELERANAAAVLVLNLSADDPLGLWVRGASLLRRGRVQEARRDLERAAAQKAAPFVAAAAHGMLEELP